ncbi:hypothetical protein ACE103_05265 [Bradyrhizobium sp. ma5]|uniref:hypothetical protein n=1 Tax=Bradyrhizobium sp. ma5 TaxID=3344828 RepID=UPI0035D51C83
MRLKTFVCAVALTHLTSSSAFALPPSDTPNLDRSRARAEQFFKNLGLHEAVIHDIYIAGYFYAVNNACGDITTTQAAANISDANYGTFARPMGMSRKDWDIYVDLMQKQLTSTLVTFASERTVFCEEYIGKKK